MNKLSLILVFFYAILSGCYYDNFEELYPGLDGSCDTTGIITYTNDIAPILTSSCGASLTGCHKTGTTSGVILDNYTNTQEQAIDGTLMGSILHDPGYSPMPKNGGFLDDCDIQKIQAWVNRNQPQ